MQRPELKTNRDWLIHIADQMVEMKGEISSTRESVAALSKHVADQHVQQNGRIEKLEHWRERVTGGALLVAKAVGLVSLVVGITGGLVAIARAFS